MSTLVNEKAELSMKKLKSTQAQIYEETTVTQAHDYIHTKAPSSSFSPPECATSTAVRRAKKTELRKPRMSSARAKSCRLSFKFQTGKTPKIMQIDTWHDHCKIRKKRHILTEKREGTQKQ